MGSAMLYGAVLYALWTIAVGLVLWFMGWIFGAQSWFIDMDLANWSEYTLTTFLGIFVTAFFRAIAGAFAGFVVALIYNAVADIMGGVKVELTE